MRRINSKFQRGSATLLLIGLVVFGLSPVAQADTNGPSLVISQLKITSSNGQFITLYNSSNTTLDMSKYQLEYFNSYDLTKATSSRLIALSGTVPPHGYFMVNDSSLLLCYQMTVDSLSLGLSSTAGMVEVLAFNQANPGGSVLPVLQDYVSWSKTAAVGAQTLPTNTNALLSRQPLGPDSNPQVSIPGSGSWQTVQPDGNNPCTLINTSSSTTVPTGMSQLLPPSEPAAVIDGSATGGVVQPGASLPASDIGLMGPQITELLPNPLGTGNDATDEFIELYNPNSVPFDLSGFSFQVGATTVHTYTFPVGTSLAPLSFKAFYSKDTGLSLSNTSGQVKLFDPLGNNISSTGLYDTAKDGVSWALAQGKWYWTTNVTPDATNVIKQPATAKKSSAASAAKTKSSARAKTKASKKLKTSLASSSAGSTDDSGMTPVHPWTLAIIGGLALLYGVYEYRADLANRVYQFRRYLERRRENWSSAPRRRSD